MYKLTKHVRSATDTIYSYLQENISKGNITEGMIPYLKERVVAQCDTMYENEFYQNGRQVMITPKHESKDKFNELLLQKLDGEMHEFLAIDNLPVTALGLPDISYLHEGHKRPAHCPKSKKEVSYQNSRNSKKIHTFR